MLFLDHEIVFGSFTNLFILGWLMLLAASYMKETTRLRRTLLIVGSRIIPLVLFAVFTIGWALTRGLPGDITSLAGVLTSYTVPEKVLIAWFEILGLALLVCRWMIDDAAAEGFPKLLLTFSLVVAFIAAAIGVIVYLILVGVLKLWVERNAVSSN